MGKAEITSGKRGGLYSVKLVYNRDGLENNLAKVLERLEELPEEIEALESELSDLEASLEPAAADLDQAIAQWQPLFEEWKSKLEGTLNRNPFDGFFVPIRKSFEDQYELWDPDPDPSFALDESMPDLSPVIHAQTEVVRINTEIDRVNAALAYKELEQAAIELKRDEINATIERLDNVSDVWCADLTTDLEGEVQSMEVKGQPDQVILAPGYNADLYTLGFELVDVEYQIIQIQRDVEDEIVSPRAKQEPHDPDATDPVRTAPMRDPIEATRDPTEAMRDPIEATRDPEPIDESVDEEEDPDGKSVTGTIREEGTMAALENITVALYRKEGVGEDATFSYVRQAKTESDGTYEIKGLAAGTYLLKFSDSNGNYLTSYYSGKTTLDLATDIVVTAAANVTGKDATLGPAASISGTVTS